MSITLKKLCSENDNVFRLTLRAGGNGFRNAVTWVYMVEDEYIAPYFHGSELAVTTGIRAAQDPEWLMSLVRSLVRRRAAGLIVNTGKYITRLPQEALDYCEEQEFPLLTMPWEIRVTEMLQSFCTRIIQEQSDSAVFDRALRDAIYRRGSEEEWREILSRYYDPEGSFIMFVIRSGDEGQARSARDDIEYRFINRLRRFKTVNGMKAAKFGLLYEEGFHLMLAGNVDAGKINELLDIVLSVYGQALEEKNLFVGVGTEVTGMGGISKSFERGRAAMRMAVYQRKTWVRFEDMGFYRVLLSVRDEEALYDYADTLLSPIDGDSAKNQGYMELLRAYIGNDRSLERTAEELYLHRNTVNYRLQKMKTLLNSPLKTVEDLFPYQVALAIRDLRQGTVR